MIKQGFHFVVIAVLFSLQAWAQENDRLHYFPGGDYFRSYYSDARDNIRAPFVFGNHAALKATALFGATALVYTQDLQVKNWFMDHRSGLTQKLSHYGLEPLGSGKYTMGFMGAFYLHGVFFKNQRSIDFAYLGVRTFLVTGLLVRIPKHFFQRERPYYNPNDPSAWRGPWPVTTQHSFVSGHTTSVFAMATLIAEEFKEYRAVPVICYTLAGLSGLSRIHDNQHWASDIFAGAVLGWGMTKLIYRKNKKKLK